MVIVASVTSWMRAARYALWITCYCSMESALNLSSCFLHFPADVNFRLMVECGQLLPWQQNVAMVHLTERKLHESYELWRIARSRHVSYCHYTIWNIEKYYCRPTGRRNQVIRIHRKASTIQWFVRVELHCFNVDACSVGDSRRSKTWWRLTKMNRSTRCSTEGNSNDNSEHFWWRHHFVGELNRPSWTVQRNYTLTWWSKDCEWSSTKLAVLLNAPESRS